jgi:hypothetical protein
MKKQPIWKGFYAFSAHLPTKKRVAIFFSVDIMLFW